MSNKCFMSVILIHTYVFFLFFDEPLDHRWLANIKNDANRHKTDGFYSFKSGFNLLSIDVFVSENYQFWKKNVGVCVYEYELQGQIIDVMIKSWTKFNTITAYDGWKIFHYKTRHNFFFDTCIIQWKKSTKNERKLQF